MKFIAFIILTSITLLLGCVSTQKPEIPSTVELSGDYGFSNLNFVIRSTSFWRIMLTPKANADLTSDDIIASILLESRGGSKLAQLDVKRNSCNRFLSYAFTQYLDEGISTQYFDGDLRLEEPLNIYFQLLDVGGSKKKPILNVNNKQLFLAEANEARNIKIEAYYAATLTTTNLRSGK